MKRLMLEHHFFQEFCVELHYRRSKKSQQIKETYLLVL